MWRVEGRKGGREGGREEAEPQTNPDGNHQKRKEKKCRICNKEKPNIYPKRISEAKKGSLRKNANKNPAKSAQES